MSSLDRKPLNFRVSPPARLQVMRLSDEEKRRLADLLAAPDRAKAAETRATSAGRFVSRLSATKRVLWTNTDAVPTILSIADGSYSANS